MSENPTDGDPYSGIVENQAKAAAEARQRAIDAPRQIQIGENAGMDAAEAFLRESLPLENGFSQITIHRSGFGSKSVQISGYHKAQFWAAVRLNVIGTPDGLPVYGELSARITRGQQIVDVETSKPGQPGSIQYRKSDVEQLIQRALNSKARPI